LVGLISNISSGNGENYAERQFRDENNC